jgi:hypothetical protein
VLIDNQSIGAALNRNLGSPTAPGEAVESELWQASVKAYEEKRRQMARLEWHAFHCGQAARHRAVLESLIAFHEEQAAKLLNTQQEGAV